MKSAGPPTPYTIDVRSLCAFTAKQGDLDRRFTPSATAAEGLQGEQLVAARRGPAYQRQLVLATTVGLLQVRGRADGWDPAERCLEEVKAIRGPADAVPANRRHLHWAQLETYGALLCRRDGRRELQLALVYVDVVQQTETVLRVTRSADELEAALHDRCARFVGWATQEAAHRHARDARLAQLPFPLGDFRPGQRSLSEAVYRAALGGRCLLAQAPTGIGKTLGTLYPMLRALPVRGIDKLGFLTCKNTGRAPALHALQLLRGTTAAPLRVLDLVAKTQACEHPGSACHGDACPLARGFYDRLPAARAEAVQAGWMDAAAQRQIALRHGVCPYYLGQELLRWTDVVVGDVHHFFDPAGHLLHLQQATEMRLALLVDEGHNLVPRTRRMFSAELSLQQVASATAAAPAGMRPAFQRLQTALQHLARQQAQDYAAYADVPDALSAALRGLNTLLGAFAQTEPLPVDALLQFYFASLQLQRLLEQLGSHSLLDLHRDPADPGDVLLSLRNIVPAPFLRKRFEACQSVVVFSATLGAECYQRDLLGLPDTTGWLDVPPVFAPEHLVVRVARGVSTRYAARAASLPALVEVLAAQFDAHPGNYLAFFSSFDYLEDAQALLALRRPQIPQWSQARQQDALARAAFLDRFTEHGQGIGFAVLGGSFAEGVDLPGRRLIGAFVATLGLPPVSPVQDQIRARLDAVFGPGHGYADLLPGLQKVIQAAGRVLRTPEDRGFLWLIDDRYRRPAVRALLPAAWQLCPRDAAQPACASMR